MDYMGMTEREPMEDDFPTLIMHDRESGSNYAHVVTEKGVEEDREAAGRFDI